METRSARRQFKSENVMTQIHYGIKGGEGKGDQGKKEGDQNECTVQCAAVSGQGGLQREANRSKGPLILDHRGGEINYVGIYYSALIE